MVPVPKRCLNQYLYTVYIYILYMELMKLQEIPNMDKGIAIAVTE